MWRLSGVEASACAELAEGLAVICFSACFRGSRLHRGQQELAPHLNAPEPAARAAGQQKSTPALRLPMSQHAPGC